MKDANKRGLTQKNAGRMLSAGHPVTLEGLAWHLNGFRRDPEGLILVKPASDGKPAVFQLDRHEGARIVQLIRALNEVDRIARAKGYPRREDLLRYADGKEAKILLAKIEATMRPVWLSPRPISPSSGGWKTIWHTDTGTLFNFVVAPILNWAMNGQLTRLSECAACGEWFVKARNLMSRRFCCVNCRTSSDRKSPKGRQRRRTYMHEYMRKYRK
jgi:hypothetical protein